MLNKSTGRSIAVIDEFGKVSSKVVGSIIALSISNFVVKIP